jgi:hypothetical protein
MKQPKSNSLPTVEFEYPDSESGLLRTRTVKVVELNSAYVSGYELPHPLATVEAGKFKTYKLARITRDGVVLRSFKADVNS